MLSFPAHFQWGTASASYQIEGGAFEDDKGASIWDVFTHTPGKIAEGHHGDIACDAYHRWAEDLDLMATLGIPHYRFSVNWPRIFPAGDPGLGFSQAGLRYYDDLIDGCLARGITPWLTLYHWELPQALQESGGWENRRTASCFADMADFLAKHFAGRVRHFITINEPQIAIGMGYGNGLHAPGLQLPPARTFRAWHHLLLAHGLAVQAIRRQIPDAQIGASSTGMLSYVTGSGRSREQAQMPEDQLLAHLAETSFHTGIDPASQQNYFFQHQWFLDPIVLGQYPMDPASPWQAFADTIDPEDLRTICQPLDFLGLNLYNGTELDPDADFAPRPKYPGYPRNSLHWPITPPVMYWGPKQIFDRYRLPIIITENGQCAHDHIHLDGQVHDPQRIDCLSRYLQELARAIRDGVPVLGYFHWSFTDNFEWHSGYDHRFGLVYVDYPSQRRIPKDSARWYAALIAATRP